LRQNLCIFRHLARFLRVSRLYSLNREVKTAMVNSRTMAGSVFLPHHDLFRVPKVLAPLYPEFILPKRSSWI
jgi:hypothetical protein